MRGFLKGVYILWYRDLLRFVRNKTRVLAGISFPVLWLLIFGNGISASLSLPIPGVKFVQFLFPGVIAQFLIFTASFSAISILQDREFGFMKEILVSPISRLSIAIGKVLGGATTSTLLALPILILAPLVGIRLNLKMAVLLLPAMFLLATTLSAMGVALVSRLKSMESGQYIFQFITFPLTFLSGAVFPLVNLPSWLNVATKINPLSYAVDILRRIVFSNSNLPMSAADKLSPNIGGRVVTMPFDLMVVGSFTILMIVLSAWIFSRND